MTTTTILTISTPARSAFVNITEELQRVLAKNGVPQGRMVVAVLHTTAGVFVNEPEAGLLEDFKTWLDGLAPQGGDYAHHKIPGERNADSHLKALLVGHDVTLVISDGRLALGEWQAVHLAEFDGPRERRIQVQVIGD
jgi:secondary thiamine-phosphate synthase enzyme